MKYTLKHLKDIARQYKDNMVMLMKVKPGTSLHKQYVQVERRLNALDLKIRRRLNIFLPDPCPLTEKGRDCVTCSGYIKKIPNKLNTRKKMRTVVAEQSEAEAVRCALKEIMVLNIEKGR